QRVPPGEGVYTVRIPQGQATTFAERWARQEASDEGFRPYAVRFGERLPDVARAFGVAVATLAEANLLSETSRIEPGTVLRVPKLAAAPPASPSEAEPELRVVAVPDVSPPSADQQPVF